MRMSGAGCIALADSIFIGKKNLTEKATHTLSYGKITDGAGGEIIDEVLVSVMKAPHTYTKEDIVEINCHGVSLFIETSFLEGLCPSNFLQGESGQSIFLTGRRLCRRLILAVLLPLDPDLQKLSFLRE